MRLSPPWRTAEHAGRRPPMGRRFPPRARAARASPRGAAPRRRIHRFWENPARAQRAPDSESMVLIYFLCRGLYERTQKKDQNMRCLFEACLAFFPLRFLLYFSAEFFFADWGGLGMPRGCRKWALQPPTQKIDQCQKTQTVRRSDGPPLIFGVFF